MEVKHHLEAKYSTFGDGSTYQNCCGYKSAGSTFQPGFNTTVGAVVVWACSLCVIFRSNIDMCCIVNRCSSVVLNVP